MERILAEPTLNKYCAILLVCKETENSYARDQWMLGEAKDVRMENFWNWYKMEVTGADEYPVGGSERCNGFEKDIWLKLEKSMLQKHRSTFQNNVKYIHNYIVKPFRVIILHYSKSTHKIHELYKQLHIPFKEGKMYNPYNQRVCDNDITEYEICVAKDGLPTSVQDKMEDRDAEY